MQLMFPNLPGLKVAKLSQGDFIARTVVAHLPDDLWRSSLLSVPLLWPRHGPCLQFVRASSCLSKEVWASHCNRLQSPSNAIAATKFVGVSLPCSNLCLSRCLQDDRAFGYSATKSKKENNIFRAADRGKQLGAAKSLSIQSKVLIFISFDNLILYINYRFYIC